MSTTCPEVCRTVSIVKHRQLFVLVLFISVPVPVIPEYCTNTGICCPECNNPTKSNREGISSEMNWKTKPEQSAETQSIPWTGDGATVSDSGAVAPRFLALAWAVTLPTARLAERFPQLA